MSYRDDLQSIAAMAVSQPARLWIKAYHALRKNGLMGELRNATHETFEKIQGQLNENDKLLDLVNMIENAKFE